MTFDLFTSHIGLFVTFLTGGGALAILNFWQRRRTNSSALVKEEVTNVEDLAKQFYKMQDEHLENVAKRNQQYLELQEQIQGLKVKWIAAKAIINNADTIDPYALDKLKRIFANSEI